VAEALADRQTQASAPILPGRGGVGLGKILKQATLLLGRHANTRIGDTEDEPVPTGLCDATHLQRDRALLRELTGITEQVQQTLAHPDWVSVHQVPCVSTMDFERVAITLQERFNGGNDLGNEPRDAKCLQDEFYLAGLDFREIEDGVDERQQVLPSRANLLEVGEHRRLPLVGSLLE
jgi:hypothetical protein